MATNHRQHSSASYRQSMVIAVLVRFTRTTINNSNASSSCCTNHTFEAICGPWYKTQGKVLSLRQAPSPTRTQKQLGQETHYNLDAVSVKEKAV